MVRTVGRILFILLASCVAVVVGIAGGAYLYADENAAAFSPRSEQTEIAARTPEPPDSWARRPTRF